MESRRRNIHNVKRKKNSNKIKTTYSERVYWRHRYWWSPTDQPVYELWTIDAIGYHRQIRTTNERRQNLAHADEYGAQIVRGARRGRNLPDAWEDKNIGVWKNKGSWKHNSKRPNQYKV